MHLLKKCIPFLLLFILFSGGLRAQKAEQEKLKSLLKKFGKAYENLSKTKDRSTVMKYIAPDLITMNILSKFEGSLSGETGDYHTLDKFLSRISHMKGLSVKYKITGIDNVRIKANTAVLVYSVDFEFAKNKEPWSKGSETVLMMFRKYNGVWKIGHFTFISIEDEKYVGKCSCELFTSPSGDYMTKTAVPSGKNYKTEMNNFSFTDDKNGDRLITVGDLVYTWRSNNQIISPEGQDEVTIGKDALIGSARNTLEAVRLIIQKSLFKKPCSSIKFTRKR